jgi:CPA2 family monovalent cation:H+ antiporter-2
LVLAGLTVILGIAFWRSVANLQGHVRAGAQIILELLTAQTRKSAAPPQEQALTQVCEILPGLGTPVPVRLERASPAVGKTLAELNLRGRTGATVLAITRDEGGISVPKATEVLRPGDVLALAGTREAVEEAKSLLLV